MKPEVIGVSVLLILYGFDMLYKAPARDSEGTRQFSAGMGCATVLSALLLLAVAAAGWIFERA